MERMDTPRIKRKGPAWAYEDAETPAQAGNVQGEADDLLPDAIAASEPNSSVAGPVVSEPEPVECTNEPTLKYNKEGFAIQPGKRGRGRPRKDGLPTMSQAVRKQVWQTLGLLPKRKPGRPPKVERHPPIPPEIIKAMGGRTPSELTPDELTGQLHRQAANVHGRMTQQAIRDIHPLPTETINWERRNACQFDLQVFAKTYLPNTFNLNWSSAQEVCAKKIQRVFVEGGKFAVAMPRGSGKTALCRAGIIHGTAYGFRTYPFLIGSSQDKAEATLDYIKTAWYGSRELREDFPEIGYPIFRLENRWHLAKGQIFKGQSTYIEWGATFVRYPSLLLSKEEAEPYRLNCEEDFLIWLPDHNSYMTRTAGTVVQTSGIDGSIRGEAGVHPILISQPRPDVVLLDDIQKDRTVDSELNCQKLILMIDGAVAGLAGPSESLAVIMPCTVMREGDVADTFVDPEKKPEYRGERRAMVESWPPGIDDQRITLDTPASIAWNDYIRLRKESLRIHGDNRLAKDYYIANRTVMDENFVCSWAERFDVKTQISAQQAAMDLRAEIGSQVFLAEYQNKGRKPLGEGIVMITAKQLASKTVSLIQRRCPLDTRSLVAYVDVQNEILYYTTLATAPDFSGVVVDYGAFPEPFMPFFRKAQTEEWSLLSKLFFERYPDQIDKGTHSRHGFRAPLEAKIYHALSMCVRHLLTIEYIRDDAQGTPVHLQRIGIDTRWGQVSDTIKRFIREWSSSVGKERPTTADNSGYATRDILVPCSGQGVTALQKQFEEYQRPKGWLFEDQINRTAKEVRWIWKPNADGLYFLLIDTNRMKTFTFQRLASPPGSPGSISLFDAPPDLHELFARHICDSEFPEVVFTTRNAIVKEMWKVRESSGFDNDFLDCMSGCCALASFNGSQLEHFDDIAPSYNIGSNSTTQRMSEAWRAKKANRAG